MPILHREGRSEHASDMHRRNHVRPDTTPPAPHNRRGDATTPLLSPSHRQYTRIAPVHSPPVRPSEPPQASAGTPQAGDSSIAAPPLSPMSLASPTTLLSPREHKRRDTMERLHALQALDERRRHGDLERRLRGLEEAAGVAGGDGDTGSVLHRVCAVEGEMAQLRAELSLSRAETHSLRELVAQQSREIALLMASRHEAARPRSPTQSPQREHSASPPFAVMTPDRNNPNWLRQWQHDVGHLTASGRLTSAAVRPL